MKKVFAVLVNYNGLSDTLECLASMQNESKDYELTSVVVDNASERDETETIRKQFPQVITIRSDVNGGFSYGNNIGIKYALENGADYIMLLNNDTVVAPDMISLLLADCDENVVTVPKMLYYSEKNRIWYGGGKISKWTGSASHLGQDETDDTSEQSSFCSFATGCCIMLKAETFKKVGLLNERYFLYYEDVEFSVRLAYENIRIKYIPSARLWHKVSASTGGSRSRLTVYYATRNLSLIHI